MVRPSRGIIQSLPQLTQTLSSDDPITILHVDDGREYCELVKDFLESERASFAVSTETDAQVALERVCAEPERFDCVLSDYQMPKLDGFELLERIRGPFPELPFILLTGRGSEDLASEAISRGVTDYLTKKVDPDHFTVVANRIENAVMAHRAERRTQQVLQATERAREGIGLVDRSGEFFYVNPAFERISGHRQDALTGAPWERVYPAQVFDDITANILPTIEDAGRWEGYVNLRRPDGDTVMVEQALSYTDTGGIACFIDPFTQ